MCLLAEDESALRDLLTVYLEEAGFTVIVADGGADAMLLLDATDRPISALVTDIRMPHVDGWQLARHARERVAGIPVVYMSGDSAATWDVEGVPNSVMLAKPFVGAQLITALSTLLNQAQPHSEPR